jgi:phosphate starvation-inducible protein PhoH
MRRKSHIISDVSGIPSDLPKKRGRKPRKQNEKEIWLEHSFFEQEIHEPKCIYHFPKNRNQEEYSLLLQDKKNKIVVVNGPAGTGKTLFATEYGIRYFLTEMYEKIIFTRPSVTVDEDLGYLPGTLEEKMAPWIRPIYDILYRFFTIKEVTQMIEDRMIEIAPLGYMRGRTFTNTWIVADEMQNATVSQMKMLMTRVGQNCRLVITGDLDQSDSHYSNGLEDFLQRFQNFPLSQNICSFTFDKSDIQREEVVKEVLEIYC